MSYQVHLSKVKCKVLIHIKSLQLLAAGKGTVTSFLENISIFLYVGYFYCFERKKVALY